MSELLLCANPVTDENMRHHVDTDSGKRRQQKVQHHPERRGENRASRMDGECYAELPQGFGGMTLASKAWCRAKLSGDQYRLRS